ncbi:MAG TPA: hypothetical protein VGK73_11240, partial [Polyangiaceae bacterium]
MTEASPAKRSGSRSEQNPFSGRRTHSTYSSWSAGKSAAFPHSTTAPGRSAGASRCKTGSASGGKPSFMKKSISSRSEASVSAA